MKTGETADHREDGKPTSRQADEGDTGKTEARPAPASTVQLPAVAMYQSEAMAICRQSFESGEIETGGELYGLRGNDGRPVVLLATSAGEAAMHGTARFGQDVEHVQACARFLRQTFGLDYLGRWHLHHVLGLEQPSGQDERSATSIRTKNDLPSFVELIVTFVGSRNDRRVKVSAFEYVDGRPETRALRVVPSTSPVRKQLLGTCVFPDHDAYAWRFPWDKVLIDEQTGNAPGDAAGVEVPEALIDQIAALPETAQRTVRLTVGSDSIVVQFLLANGRRCRVGYLPTRLDRPIAVAAQRSPATEYADLTDMVNPTDQALALRDVCSRASRCGECETHTAVAGSSARGGLLGLLLRGLSILSPALGESQRDGPPSEAKETRSLGTATGRAGATAEKGPWR